MDGSNVEKAPAAMEVTSEVTEVMKENAFPPGTAFLVDTQHVLHTVHTKDEVVLIPAPSDDESDPLNWSTFRKLFAMFLVCLWAFMLGATTLSPGVANGALIPGLRTSINYLNTASAVMIFCLGFFNVFFSPLAEHFGRRTVYVTSSIICCISQIVQATATSKEQFFAGRVLLGIGAAPFEQLPAVSVDDQFHVHQRGFGLSLYIISITVGSFLGPVATGYVVQSHGWQWVFWMYAIIMGAITVILALGLEETAFARHLSTPAETAANGKRVLIKPRKSFWQMRPLFRRIPRQTTYLQTLIKPVHVMFLPITLWCGMAYGFGVTWLSIMAVTAFTVYQTVYLFSFSQTGLTNLAPMVGGIIAIYVGGAGMDRLLVWKAKRDNGIMHPETRLFAIFIGGPIMSAGLILYGVGAAKAIHWFAVVFGMSLIGFGLPVVASTALGYSIESYPLLAGEVTVAVIFWRNVIGCAMTYAIAPWIEGSGLQNCFISVGILAFVAMVSGTLLIVFGQKLRKSSAELYIKLTSQQG